MSTPDTSGDTPPSTLEEVIGLWRPSLVRYVSRLLNDAHLAEDVVQDVMIKLTEYWTQGHCRPETVKSWLFRVAHNRAIDHVRGNKRRKKLRDHASAQMELDWGRTDVNDMESRMKEVLQLVQELDPRERQVLLLRLQQGLSYREIAEVMEENEGTVGYLLHLAVRKMTELLRRAGVLS